MLSIRTVVGRVVRRSSSCRLREDWCLCAYKITHNSVHLMCLALRMTWQTLGPVYRFRDFNALLQHTSSWPRYLTRPSNNQIIGNCGKTFIGFQPPAIFSPYHIGELVGYRAPSQWKCLGSLSVLYLCHPQIWPFSLLICTNIIIPHPP